MRIVPRGGRFVNRIRRSWSDVSYRENIRYGFGTTRTLSSDAISPRSRMSAPASEPVIEMSITVRGSNGLP